MEKVLRWTALVIGCVGMGVSGSVFAFNAYVNAIKKTFNYTQSDGKSALPYIIIHLNRREQHETATAYSVNDNC